MRRALEDSKNILKKYLDNYKPMDVFSKLT